MMLARSRLLFAAALLVSACGSADSTKVLAEAHAELGRGNHQSALKGFQNALAQMDAANPDFVAAKMGEIEAWTYIDAAKAKENFLAFAATQKTVVTARDYFTVASNLTLAKKFNEAVAVLGVGRERFEDDEKLGKLAETIAAEAQKANEPDVLAELKKFGYLGDK